MNNVELARTLSWRENALFKEREKNVFVKPDERCRACSNIVMARKRTFRGTRKELISSTTHHLNHLINSKQHLAGKMKQSAIRWDNNDLLPIEWRFVRFSNSYISLIKLSVVCREAAFLTLIFYARGNTPLPFLMPIGALFAILSLLFSRTAAMRARDVFLLLGLGFHLFLLLVAARRALAESHSATRDYLIDVHEQNVLWVNGGKVLRP